MKLTAGKVQLNNIIIKIKNRLSGILKNKNGYDIEYHPFGKTVKASKEYLDLWYEAKNTVHPAIDEYEKLIGYKIEYDWFHELALHTDSDKEIRIMLPAWPSSLFYSISLYKSE